MGISPCFTRKISGTKLRTEFGCSSAHLDIFHVWLFDHPVWGVEFGAEPQLKDTLFSYNHIDFLGFTHLFLSSTIFHFLRTEICWASCSTPDQALPCDEFPSFLSWGHVLHTSLHAAGRSSTNQLATRQHDARPFAVVQCDKCIERWLPTVPERV